MNFIIKRNDDDVVTKKIGKEGDEQVITELASSLHPLEPLGTATIKESLRYITLSVTLLHLVDGITTEKDGVIVEQIVLVHQTILENNLITFFERFKNKYTNNYVIWIYRHEILKF